MPRLFFVDRPDGKLLGIIPDKDMRKAVLIILAVAVLGVLGAYASRLPDNTPQSSATGLSSLKYKDGNFIGESAETPYGPIQIGVVIQKGKITEVNFLDMPSDDARSTEITGFATPALRASTLKAQSADIDFVSGATSTSYGYQQSLQAALDKAAASAVNAEYFKSG